MSMKIGDKVRVVNYGHIIHRFNGEGWTPVDILPSIVGKTGTIREVDIVQGERHYALKGIPQKEAWYYEDQLEKI